jgi:hypothetical protein
LYIFGLCLVSLTPNPCRNHKNARLKNEPQCFIILIADIIVFAHLLFILFVLLGGLLVLKWKWMVYLHIPAAIWGALIEFMGWICPLTPLENRLRRMGGEIGYSGDFVEQYIIPLIYPRGLTREIQIILGIAVIVMNLAVYFVVIRRWIKRKD